MTNTLNKIIHNGDEYEFPGIPNDTTGTTSIVSNIWVGTSSEYNLITPKEGQLSIVLHEEGGGGWQPGVNTKVYYNINDNDTNSTIYDLSGNGVDQTWYGTPGYTTDATYGRVATFNGSSYTQTGSIVDFGSECTFIALYKKTTAAQNMAVVIECASSSQYGIGIANEFDADKSQVWFAGSGGGRQVQSSTLATTNWVMVAGTIDSTFTTRIYINGVLDNTSTDGTSAPGYSGGENLQIGRWRNGAPRYLDGQFKLFIGEDRCWTAQEIADLASEYGF